MASLSSVEPEMKSRLPRTSAQFQQMINAHLQSEKDPDKFIQIATYIAMQMAKEMKRRDDANHHEYVRIHPISDSSTNIRSQ